MSQKHRSTNFDEVRRITDESIKGYDIIRRYDHAMLEYFSMWIPFTDEETGEPREGRVPFIFATPKREHSGDDEHKTGLSWFGDFAPTQMERIVYPGMTLTRLDATFDQARWTYAESRKLGFSHDLNLVLTSHFPLPYNFLYQIDFWAETYHDLNIFFEDFARKFPRPTYYLDVTYPIPWGEQAVHMQSQGTMNMTSVLEGGEQQRELRGVASVVLYGWIPLSPEWKRTVQRYGISIIEQSSEEILETMYTEWADKNEFWETGEYSQILEWE